MKKYFLSLLVLLISGCSLFKPEEPIVIQPKLVKQYALPTLTQNIYIDQFEFYCEMMIDEKGDVVRVKMLKGSSDATWDTLATESLMKWKYQPATYGGNPIKMLVRTKVRVLFTEPAVLTLAEIELDNYQLADSIYTQLQKGQDFYGLASSYSISPSKDKNGLVGEVNIKLYSRDIRAALADLKIGEITKVLSYGDHFMIFKRIN